MRRAFSFIELVVSIVVIGIAFLSVPLILSENTESVDVSLQQEAVMGGLTHMAKILSYRWDESETNPSLNGGYAKVVAAPAGDSELACSGGWRIGHFHQTDRRRCYNPTLFASNIGLDAGESTVADADDIDDFNQPAASMLSGPTTSDTAMDYKKNYTISTSVYYISDAMNYAATSLSGAISETSVGTSASQATNLKLVTVTVTEPNNGNRVLLHAFVPNIGEYKIFYRVIQ